MVKPSLVEVFESSVADDFLPKLTRGVEKVYRNAPSRVARLPEEQASNLLPFYRWCLLDTELLALASPCS